jgi:hypothetical protein
LICRHLGGCCVLSPAGQEIKKLRVGEISRIAELRLTAISSYGGFRIILGTAGVGQKQTSTLTADPVVTTHKRSAIKLGTGSLFV